MKVVVCYKWIPDDSDIKVDRATRRIDLSSCKWLISLYDKNAIEAGVALAEKQGASSVALSVGPKVADSRKDALSRGPEEALLVADPALEDADSFVTANVLAAAVRSLGGVDLVVCGEGSGDVYAQQVGPRVASKLGWPVITYATSIEAEDGGITVSRAVEEGIEVLSCPLPAVITMAGDCNTPRLPTMKAILGAGKKPYQTLALDDLSLPTDELTSRIRPLKTVGNVPDRKNIRIKGTPQEAADEAVRALISEGVI